MSALSEVANVFNCSVAAGGSAATLVLPRPVAALARLSVRMNSRLVVLSWLILNPRDLRTRRDLGRVVGRKRRQCGVADQEGVEVLGQVLIAGTRFCIAHVRGIASEQHVPDPVLLQKRPQLI